MRDTILKKAEQFHTEVTGFRRHLHMNPELSYVEYNTGKYISEQLRAWGIEHQHGVAGTGVVALVKGKNPKKKVTALRADIDALPIQEANDVPYKSQKEGIMHACGHDVHTASLLGACRILHEMRDQFEGTVKCIFQPGEEKLPGGASIMIKEGVLKNPAPSAIFGQHVHPPLHVGKVGFKAGRYMASADELYLTIKGRGGHGALPQNCIDPVVITAQIITALQQIVSRYGNPTIPSVLTFGKINSTGGATNIIPNEVKLEGTFRTMDEKWRKEAHHRMTKIAKSIAKGMGGACEVHIPKGYPSLFNNEPLTNNAIELAEGFLGKNKVERLPIRMTAEDFSFYGQKIPACFYRLGTGNPARGITAPVHNHHFDIDEDALVVGMGLMAYLALTGN